MKIKIPSYEEIKEFDYWVPPQPACLMLTVVDFNDEEVEILFLPEDEDVVKDFPNELMRPRHITVNKQRVDFKSDEEKEIIELLRHLVNDKRWGPVKNLAYEMANEMIQYFSRGNKKENS